MKKLSWNLIINILAAAIYLLAANPAITGLAVHEWLSLGLIGIFILHCATYYDVIVNVLRRRASKGQVANFILDLATLIMFILVTVSGLLVSRYLLPVLGLVAPGYFFWAPLHAISAKILLALLLIHVVVHWKWFATLLSRAKPDKANSQNSSSERSPNLSQSTQCEDKECRKQKPPLIG